MTAHGEKAVLSRTLPAAVLKKKFFPERTIILSLFFLKIILKLPGIQDVGYFMSHYK